VAPSELKRLASLEQMVDDIAAGLYRIPIGPGAINNRALKPKSVTAGTISVSDLESVNAKTGNLTANGTITVNSTGSIAIGKTSYADDSTGGMWVGYSGGTYKLNLGNSTYSVKWDGSALNITGNITATTGTIGGWTIGATDLTSDAGATGMASSGGYRIWVGDATPANAEFRVSSAGALTATSATITGAITATSGTLGTLSITGTLNMASGSIFKSGMTAHGTGSGWWFENNAGTPIMAIGSNSSSGFSFNGTNMYLFGQAVIGTIEVSTNGNIRSGASSYASGTGWILEYNGGTPRFRVGTATSGTNYLAFDGTNIEMRGKMKFGSGGNSYLDGTIQHFELTGSNTAVIEMKAGAANPAIQIQGFANSTDAQSTYSATATNAGTLRAGSVFVNATAADNTTNVTVRASKSGVTQSEFVAEGDGYAYVGLGDSAGAKNFEVRDSSGAMVLGVNSNGELIRPITNDATALGAYYGRVPIYINGSLKYLGVYS
jgi:hypothetical protein